MEDWGARPHRLCDWERGSEGPIRGREKEARGGGLIFGGVKRKAAGNTLESEIYQCEVFFLLCV